jgi:hypothetical protein
VPWLWTDTLAALLVERDQVAAARLAGWVERPVAYRAGEEEEAIELARGLFGREEAEPAPERARRLS